MTICPICEKGKLKKKLIDYSVYGVELGRFPANVCSQCGEQWFDEETALKIEKREKEKDLFGLSVKSRISYSGNSLMIRIPKAIANFLNLKKKKEIIMYPEGKRKLTIEF